MTGTCVHCKERSSRLDRAGWCPFCLWESAYGKQLPMPALSPDDEPVPPCPDWLAEVLAQLEAVAA
jgi:hypothetical protein